MAEQRVYVCSNCKTPIEPVFPQGYEDTYGFRCPGTNPGCSPREDRELLTEEQVSCVEIEVPSASWERAGAVERKA